MLALALAAAVLAAPMPAPEVIDAGAYRIERVEGGDGPPLVLVHGFASSFATWESIWPRLERRFHVHAYNTLGTGASDAPVNWSLEEHVAQLGAYLDAAGMTEPVFLVGNSMGGQIATVFAAEHPERVAGLALLDPSGGSEATPAFGAAVYAAYSYAERPVDRGTEPFVRRVLLDLTANDALVTDAMVASYLPRWTTESGRDAVIGVVEDMRCDRPQHLYALRTAARGAGAHPVLIVWGEEDPWFPPSGAEAWAAALPGARVVRVPDAGHLPHVDQPRAVAKALIGAFAHPMAPVAPPPVDLDSLEAGIADADVTLAAYRTRALGDLGDPAAVPRLIGALYDPRPPVAAAAALALGALGQASVEPLLDLRTTDPNVPVERIFGLTRDPEALGLLVEELSDPAAAAAAATGLAAAGSVGRSLLIEATTAPDPVARAAAVTALGPCPDPTAGAARVAALADPDPSVAKAALVSFVRHPDDRAVVPLLARVVRDQDKAAAQAAGCAGESALRPLLALLEGRTLTLAIAGLETAAGARPFGRCEPDVPVERLAPLVDPLADIVLGLAPPERAAVARILGRAGGDRAVDALIGLLADTDGGVRAEAAEQLGALGDGRAAPALAALLDDPDARVAATVALGDLDDLGGADVTAPLLAAMADGSDAAARTLGATRDPAAIDALVAASRSDQPYVPAAAIDALGAFVDDRALARLDEASGDEALGSAWLDALDGGADPRHVGLLLRVLRDERFDEGQRLRATQALAARTGAWFPPTEPDAWEAWLRDHP